MAYDKKVILQISNIVAFVVTFIINMLSAVGLIANITPGDLSEENPNLFVPAGLTFSIWSVIYVLLTLFALYQARDLVKEEKIEMPFLEKIDFLFVLSSVANITWIFLWHYRLIPLSLIAMVVLFLSLLLIYLRLDIGLADVGRYEKLFVHVPFSVYIGWITVATVANVTVVLTNIGFPEFGLIAELLTVVVLIVVVLITLAILYTRKDYAYSLVILWSLYGIIIKQISVSLTVGVTAIVAMIVVFAGLIYALFDYYKNR